MSTPFVVPSPVTNPPNSYILPSTTAVGDSTRAKGVGLRFFHCRAGHAEFGVAAPTSAPLSAADTTPIPAMGQQHRCHHLYDLPVQGYSLGLGEFRVSTSHGSCPPIGRTHPVLYFSSFSRYALLQPTQKSLRRRLFFFWKLVPPSSARPDYPHIFLAASVGSTEIAAALSNRRRSGGPTRAVVG
jgi:hypothetical protein